MATVTRAAGRVHKGPNQVKGASNQMAVRSKSLAGNDVSGGF